MKKIAIVNQKIYHKKKNSRIKGTLARIKEECNADIAFSEYAGHATELVKASSAYGLIIAVGGDGTVSEIVNSMNLETQSLALLPVGTGNSLARDLEIFTIPKALEAIRRNNSSKIDLMFCEFKRNGRWHSRYVVATSGLGFVANTAIFSSRRFKSMGRFCYPASTLFTIFGQRIISADIKIDGSTLLTINPERSRRMDGSNKERIKFTNFIINNAKHIGNFCVFPQATLKDSALHMLLARTNAMTQLLSNISVITKLYFKYPGIKKRVNNLHITLDEACPLMLDGEILDCVDELKYSVLPQKLTLLA